MSDVKVEVRGIRELNKALKQIEDDLPNELKEGFKEVATMVADSARSKVPVKTGRAGRSIKPRSSKRGAALAFGGNAAPYYPWLDFGGRVGRNKSIHRDFIKEGRYVYPTIREKNPEIVEMVDKVLADVIAAAEFEQRGENK